MQTEEKIKIAIQSIRPYLQKDGGDVEFVEYTTEQIVKVKLIGACSNCDMSAMTLKAGIEESIKNVLPEVKGVEAI